MEISLFIKQRMNSLGFSFEWLPIFFSFYVIGQKNASFQGEIVHSFSTAGHLDLLIDAFAKFSGFKKHKIRK